MTNKTLHTAKGTMTLMEPGIIRVVLKENIEWTLKDAKETHEANLKLASGGKYCVYFIGNKFFIPTNEAQKYTMSKACAEYRLGAALVPQNLGLLLFANLFVKVFAKGKNPAKVFRKEKDAMKWMRELIRKAV